MSFRDDMKDWVLEAVADHGGSASIIDVAKDIWDKREQEIRSAGDRFYTWQYDLRWAAQQLRDTGRLKVEKIGSRSRWHMR